MNVVDFRRIIERAENLIHTHFHACVGDKEKIDWFGSAFRVLDELSAAECVTAKPGDLARRERVFDNFARRVDKNFELWERARAIYLEQEPTDLRDVTKAIEEVSAINEEISRHKHEIVLYRSALAHWETKASPFQVRLWNARLKQAEEAFEGAMIIAKQVCKKAEQVLKRAGD